jgi:hypothetical protein
MGLKNSGVTFLAVPPIEDKFAHLPMFVHSLDQHIIMDITYYSLAFAKNEYTKKNKLLSMF